MGQIQVWFQQVKIWSYWNEFCVFYRCITSISKKY